MLAAQARAVQSTPLITRAGRMLGMFSTHYRTPHRPTPGEIHLLDLVARQAADAIEHAQAKAALRGSEGALPRHGRQLAADCLAAQRRGATGVRQPHLLRVFWRLPRGDARGPVADADTPGRWNSLRRRIPRLRPRAPAIPRQGPRPTRRRAVAVVRIVGPATFGPDGEFLGHVGTSADITERKQAEEDGSGSSANGSR